MKDYTNQPVYINDNVVVYDKEQGLMVRGSIQQFLKEGKETYIIMLTESGKTVKLKPNIISKI